MITGQAGVKYGLQLPQKKGAASRPENTRNAAPAKKTDLGNVFGGDDSDEDFSKELERHQAKKRSDAKASFLLPSAQLDVLRCNEDRCHI